MSLTVTPGEAIALVGGSGAGKSTLVDLILGLLTPASGELLIQGRLVEDVRRAWQDSVAYVPQTIALLDDTVRANIELGAPRNDDAMWSAVRAAQLEEVISELPEGLDTRIGERGVRLSGGQRQRLGVARALYRRPAVLVLDEATSALDNETEARLTSILDGLRGTITTITVAHRLSTVRNADRTYLMAGGRVVDVGTFEELAARNTEFARLLELACRQRHRRVATSPAPPGPAAGGPRGPRPRAASWERGPRLTSVTASDRRMSEVGGGHGAATRSTSEERRR